jgi:DNA repair photolyase
MKIGETLCKNILNKSSIIGVKYSINPYIGCTHGCVYCYARFMTKWYHVGEEWGSFVDVKKNALECLQNEISRKKIGTILISSVTDPYQPAEKNISITRKILRLLQDYTFPINILTKSCLVTRDLDIISELFDAEVGLTITSYNDKTRQVFEPKASPIVDRIKALASFNEVGIDTFAFLGPLLPYLSEQDLGKLLISLADKVDRVIVDRLNIKAGNWLTIKKALEDYYPDLIPLFKESIKEESQYYRNLYKIMKKELDEREIPADILF